MVGVKVSGCLSDVLGLGLTEYYVGRLSLQCAATCGPVGLAHDLDRAWLWHLSRLTFGRASNLPPNDCMTPRPSDFLWPKTYATVGDLG